ncbi:hypothetical protein IFM89_020272 [Coptis chinensis]|uniref:CASTOR/POLLUX/SYM8 ion channel conserved domain-containing protein n=1 Tax=Coptis chinensis TaxID=261450 RepID=A0A835I1V7_9MAGN|nr:hypothetical protein IFM89_020272 [Coptis chinensis]
MATAVLIPTISRSTTAVLISTMSPLHYFFIYIALSSPHTNSETISTTHFSSIAVQQLLWGFRINPFLVAEPLVNLVGGELIETVVAHDVIRRLMIQCALQPGLAQLWEDILGFENAEFYIKRWPQLDGRRFEDVLISFPDAIPCGIKIAAYGGKITLNPRVDYVLKKAMKSLL